MNFEIKKMSGNRKIRKFDLDHRNILKCYQFVFQDIFLINKIQILLNSFFSNYFNKKSIFLSIRISDWICSILTKCILSVRFAKKNIKSLIDHFRHSHSTKITQTRPAFAAFVFSRRWQFCRLHLLYLPTLFFCFSRSSRSHSQVLCKQPSYVTLHLTGFI